MNEIIIRDDIDIPTCQKMTELNLKEAAINDLIQEQMRAVMQMEFEIKQAKDALWDEIKEKYQLDPNRPYRLNVKQGKIYTPAKKMEEIIHPFGSNN